MLEPMESGPLHITDGESVAGTLRESGLPGEVVIDGDLLYERPPRLYHGPPQPVSASFSAFARHQETILWFDHRLSSQLLRIRALDWFARQDLTGRNVSIIFADRTVLGGLTADQLASRPQPAFP
jgi:hypothetical protein